jgi:hypothetical protein
LIVLFVTVAESIPTPAVGLTLIRNHVQLVVEKEPLTYRVKHETADTVAVKGKNQEQGVGPIQTLYRAAHAVERGFKN